MNSHSRSHFLACWLVTGSFFAVGCGGGMVGGDGQSDAQDGSVIVADAADSSTMLPDVDPDVATDATGQDVFMVGAHPGLPVITDQGGTKLRHPQLIVITFSDDPKRMRHEALAQYLATSGWLATVGGEYGIGSGTVLANVRRTEASPAMMTDNDIQTFLTLGIGDGSLPRPPGGAFDNALYLVFYSAATTVTLPSPFGDETSCMEFGGYHGESTSNDGIPFAYGVIPTCDQFGMGMTPDQITDVTTSHEVIEAATDPLANSAPAVAFGRNDMSPWLLIGGEVGDLCALPSQFSTTNGYALQRVWSNAIASAGTGDPCLPAPPTPPYFYSVTADPGTDFQFVTAGSTVHVPMHAFSNGPVARWRISPRATGSFSPTVTSSLTYVNNGDAVTLTVAIPPGTPRNSYSTVYVLSYRTAADYHVTPLAFLVQ